MTDLRSVGFEEVRAFITGDRLRVYEAFVSRGPSTCSEIAAFMGLPVTSVRPRGTELRQAFHIIATGERRDGEHELKSVAPTEALALHEAARHKYALEMRQQERARVSEAASILSGAKRQPQPTTEKQAELFAA